MALPFSRPSSPDSGIGPHEARRDFLLIATRTLGATGVGLATWPFVDSLNPAADTRAHATVEVDLSPVAPGQAITVEWQGKPVFVRHRTDAEIRAARHVRVRSLPHPEKDFDRVEDAEWLVVVGVCTHLGCVPRGQRPGEPRGDFGGWFCSCHGSHYDTSGRVRMGPAPKNLMVPPHAFLDRHTLRIGLAAVPNRTANSP